VVMQPEVMGLSTGGQFTVSSDALTDEDMHIPIAEPPKACPGGCSGNGVCDIVSGTCTCSPDAEGDDCGAVSTPITLSIEAKPDTTSQVFSIGGLADSNVDWIGAISSKPFLIASEDVVVDRATSELSWTPQKKAKAGKSVPMTVVATKGGKVTYAQFKATVVHPTATCASAFKDSRKCPKGQELKAGLETIECAELNRRNKCEPSVCCVEKAPDTCKTFTKCRKGTSVPAAKSDVVLDLTGNQRARRKQCCVRTCASTRKCKEGFQPVAANAGAACESFPNGKCGHASCCEREEEEDTCGSKLFKNFCKNTDGCKWVKEEETSISD